MRKGKAFSEGLAPDMGKVRSEHTGYEYLVVT